MYKTFDSHSNNKKGKTSLMLLVADGIEEKNRKKSENT